MLLYFGRLLSLILMLPYGWVAYAAPTDWPTQHSRLALDTPQGNLHISANDYIYEAVLRLDDTDIQPLIMGQLNIPYAFNMPNYQAALISISKGNDACPVTYRWLRIDASGYSVSSEFGSCSTTINVSATAQRLTLITPNNTKPDKIDTYTFDGKTVKRQLAR